MLVMADHPQYAEQHDMAPEHNLLVSSSYTYAKGERPLSDFGDSPLPTEPLGDVARALRKEHAASKKSHRSLEK
jgi:hypothetical protein